MRVRVIAYDEAAHELVALLMPGGTREMIIDPFVGCALDSENPADETALGRACVGKFYDMPDDVHVSGAEGGYAFLPGEGQFTEAKP